MHRGPRQILTISGTCAIGVSAQHYPCFHGTGGLIQPGRGSSLHNVEVMCPIFSPDHMSCLHSTECNKLGDDLVLKTPSKMFQKACVPHKRSTHFSRMVLVNPMVYFCFLFLMWINFMFNAWWDYRYLFPVEKILNYHFLIV